jgi:molecular chaperone HtpG
MDATATRETLGFQAEVKQLLHLMVHSLYGNKEIFLRELVSNASDAIDKLRFEAITDAALFEDDHDVRIRVSADAAPRTITVSDNGIGMSRQEVIDQIGTIARSGTREFFQQLAADRAKDANLIGQFGVGFYSAFIVADRVTLLTRRAGAPTDHGVKWESAGEGEYTVETIEKATRGTDVILHLRPEEDELLSGWRLREILRKYSDHITVPILMKKEGDKDNGDEQEQINRASALWTRSKSEITDEQYDEFYKHIAHDVEPPLARVHAKVEGRQEYTQLFFIPKRAPFDLWDRERRHGIKLYVRRVFIMDDAEDLMPAYLRFVRGVIDSTDLPLNVSREILQQSRDVQNIRAASTKRVLGLLEDLAGSDPEKYATFWTTFGRVLKEGMAEEAANRDRIAKLLRFASTSSTSPANAGSEAQTVSLADYVGRMKDGQEAIYFITADSFAAARNSPHLEIFRKRDVEVLLMYDPIDEWVVSSLTEFEGKPLHSVAKGDLDLSKVGGGAEKSETAKSSADDKPLLERMQAVLKDRASAVRTTERLTESPACLVSDEHGMSMNLERILKAAGQKVAATKPILEINAAHPIVTRLKAETDEARFADWTQILFDQALLAEGGQLDDPAGFVKRLNELMLTLAGAGPSKIWMP